MMMNLDQGNDSESNLRARKTTNRKRTAKFKKEIYIHVLHLIIVDSLGHDIVI